MGVDDLADRVRHLGLRQARAETVASHVLIRRAAEREPKTLAALVHTEDTDMAHVMVAARVQQPEMLIEVATLQLVEIRERVAMSCAIGIARAFASAQ